MRYKRNNTTGQGSEAELQTMICDYLRLQYPSVIFRSDFSSGMKLSVGQAVRQKRLQSSRAWPDLFIVEPRLYYSDQGSVEEYHGLFLELKRQDAKVFKKDGSLVSDSHIQEQAAMLARLRDRGYKAEFGIGFDQCRLIIDEYLEDASEPLLVVEF